MDEQVDYIRKTIKDNFVNVLAIFLAYMTYKTYSTFSASDPYNKTSDVVNENKFGIIDIGPYLLTLIYVFYGGGIEDNLKLEDKLKLYAIPVFVVFTMLTILNIYEYNTSMKKRSGNAEPHYIVYGIKEPSENSHWDAIMHYSYLASMIMFFAFIAIMPGDMPMKTHLIIFVSLITIIFLLPLVRLQGLQAEDENGNKIDKYGIKESRSILSDMFHNAYYISQDAKVKENANEAWTIIGYIILFCILAVGVISVGYYLIKYRKPVIAPAPEPQSAPGPTIAYV